MENADSPVAEYDWQSKTSSMKERYKYIFNNNMYADVFFICGESRQRIPANKFILTTASIVFDTMFKERWSKQRSNGDEKEHETDEVVVSDIEGPVFVELLRFIYCENADLTADNVWFVYYAAKKYATDVLREQCIEFIKYTITLNNACFLLMKARALSEDNLIKLCLEVINNNAYSATRGCDVRFDTAKCHLEDLSNVDVNENFLNIDIETLHFIMEQDYLKIEEIALFHTMLRWAKHQCKKTNLPMTAENLKLVLNGAERLIRFTNMCPISFSSHVADSGVLSEKDILSVLFYHNKKPRPPSGFNDEPRNFKKDPSSMNIFVKTLPDEEMYTLQVIPSETVESVKKKVIDAVGLSIRHSKLYFERKMLGDQRTLQHYNIIEKSVLTITKTSERSNSYCTCHYGTKPYFSKNKDN